MVNNEPEVREVQNERVSDGSRQNQGNVALQASVGGARRLHRRKENFVHEHSLGITSVTIVAGLICLYCFADPSTHLGSFFGNAIADWSGVVVTVLATKYLYERGSAESRQPKATEANPVLEWLLEHSLSIFLLITGIGWVTLFLSMDANGKWGQVVGNIVSEWTQIFGLVLLTKKMIERHSKESAR